MEGCPESLTAMPGDEIEFKFSFYQRNLDGSLVEEDTSTERETVVSAGWQPIPDKKGKIWTYETVGGQLVPHTNVLKVYKGSNVKKVVQQSENPTTEVDNEKAIYSTEWTDHEIFLKTLDRMILSTHLKTAIFCMLQGDSKNLEVATFLISQRAREMKELEQAQNPSFDGK